MNAQDFAEYMTAVRLVNSFTSALEYELSSDRAETIGAPGLRIRLPDPTQPYIDRVLKAVKLLFEYMGETDCFNVIKDEAANYERGLCKDRERKLLDEIESHKRNIVQTEVNFKMDRESLKSQAQQVVHNVGVMISAQCTHAQREGQLILLQQELWSLINMLPGGSDIPF